MIMLGGVTTYSKDVSKGQNSQSVTLSSFVNGSHKTLKSCMLA